MTLAGGSSPGVSVIIPTHNRRALLDELLRALERQTYPLIDLEIIVCADGCQDGTVRMLKAKDQLPLTVLELPGSGPAVARNAGAEAAVAPLLLFLDDDVQPAPQLVEAHVRAHREHPGSVVLGPYPPAPWASRSLSRLAVRNWWVQHFAAMAEPGHRIRYTDVLTGNLSVPSEVWRDVGGLDERLKAAEDFELGLRLIKAGIPLVFAAPALGHHADESMGLSSALRRARDEGRAEALIATKHPDLGSDLKLIRWRRRASRRAAVWHRVVFRGGPRMDRLAGSLEPLAEFADRQGLRRSHFRLFRALRAYWYVRGISQSLGSFAVWRAVARKPPGAGEPPGLVLDLREGLEAAEAALDAARPRWAELRYGTRHVVHLRHSPGAERWRGEHLRAHLFAEAGPAYLRALALDGRLADPHPEARRRLVTAIDRMGRYFDRRRPPATFLEQNEQWRRTRPPDI